MDPLQLNSPPVNIVKAQQVRIKQGPRDNSAGPCLRIKQLQTLRLSLVLNALINLGSTTSRPIRSLRTLML